MNDEATILENQTDDASTPNDFVETAPETPTNSSTPEEETPLGESVESALGVPTDPDTDSDSDFEDSDPTPQKSELDELRSELIQLRRDLEDSYAKLAQMEHIEQQYLEFTALYPNTPIASLSQEVWQNVRDGNSLAAAFALAEHRKALSLKSATDSNANNRARSAGAAGNAESVEFSPAEVRAMTSQEVRANLSKIMRSMQKWH